MAHGERTARRARARRRVPAEGEKTREHRGEVHRCSRIARPRRWAGVHGFALFGSKTPSWETKRVLVQFGAFGCGNSEDALAGGKLDGALDAVERRQ